MDAEPGRAMVALRLETRTRGSGTVPGHEEDRRVEDEMAEDRFQLQEVEDADVVGVGFDPGQSTWRRRARLGTALWAFHSLGEHVGRLLPESSDGIRTQPYSRKLRSRLDCRAMISCLAGRSCILSGW